MGLHHLGERADAAGGEGLYGAGGDGVDADVSGAEVPGQVADGGFQSGLGDGHHVVIGDDLLGGVVGHGHDAAAVGHQRRGAAADGDEGVNADVVGDAEAFAGSVDELAAKLFGGGVGYGVDEDVELAELFLEGGKDGFDLGVAGYVALEAVRAGELVDEALGLHFHALVEVTNGQGGAGLVQFLGDAPGDGTLVGQPEDYGRLTCQIDHAWSLPPGSVFRGDEGIGNPLILRISANFSHPGLQARPCRRGGAKSGSRDAQTFPRSRWRSSGLRWCGLGSLPPFPQKARKGWGTQS